MVKAAKDLDSEFSTSNRAPDSSSNTPDSGLQGVMNPARSKRQIASLDSSNRETVSKLQVCLKEMGVDIFLFNGGGSFVGNQVMKLISGDGPKKITSAFENAPHLGEKFMKFLESVGEIYRLISRASFLNSCEIAEVIHLCYQFHEFFIDSFPNTPMTIKMHMLIEHVPDFVRHHRTVGLLSEQALESLHATVNKLHRRFACIRKTQRKQEMTHREHHINFAAALLCQEPAPKKRRVSKTALVH